MIIKQIVCCWRISTWEICKKPQNKTFLYVAANRGRCLMVKSVGDSDATSVYCLSRQLYGHFVLQFPRALLWKWKRMLVFRVNGIKTARFTARCLLPSRPTDRENGIGRYGNMDSIKRPLSTCAHQGVNMGILCALGLRRCFLQNLHGSRLSCPCEATLLTSSHFISSLTHAHTHQAAKTNLH